MSSNRPPPVYPIRKNVKTQQTLDVLLICFKLNDQTLNSNLTKQSRYFRGDKEYKKYI